MPTLQTVQDLLVSQLKDLYSAETQLANALPGFVESASDPNLKSGMEQHLMETKIHADRLQRIAESIDANLGSRTCAAMKGLLEEGAAAVAADADPVARDLAIISAAQKAEHYEISAYGTARTLAAALGLEDVAALLQTTLNEECATDDDLTELFIALLPQAVGVKA